MKAFKETISQAKQKSTNKAIDDYSNKIYTKQIDAHSALRKILKILRQQHSAPYSFKNAGTHYDYISHLCECRRYLLVGYYSDAYNSLQTLVHCENILQERILNATIALLEQYL